MKNPFAVLFVAFILVAPLTTLLSAPSDADAVDVPGAVPDGEGNGIATVMAAVPSPFSLVTVKGSVFLDREVDLTKIEIRYRVQGDTTWSSLVPIDANGKFILSLNDGGIYEISFKKDHYGIQSHSQNLTLSDPIDSVCILDLTSNQASEIIIAVMMTPIYGTLTGTVTNEEGVNLSEVHVELSSGGKSIANTTTKNGIFSFERIPIGSYAVTITRSDLETQTQDVTVGRDGSVLNFTAVTKAHTYIIGLDFPHTLMFIGAILGIVVIAVTGAYRFHIGNKARMGNSDEVFELDDDRDLK